MSIFHHPRLFTVAATVSTLALACNSEPSPRDLCHRLVELHCERMVECETGGGDAAVAACIESEMVELSCDELTSLDVCPAGTAYQPSRGSACLAELAEMSCATYVAGGWPSTCDEICAPDGSGDRPGGDGSEGLGALCDPAQPACGLGKKCGFVLENPDTGFGNFRCVEDGDRDVGASCNEPYDYGEHDNCRNGLVCWEGACRAYCDGHVDCGSDQRCVVSAEGYGVCADRCDLLVQDCPPTEGCYPWNQDYNVCLRAGAWEYGSCDVHEDCAAGALCVDDDYGASCERLCDAGRYAHEEAPRCDGGEVCYPLGVRWPGLAGVGLCDY